MTVEIGQPVWTNGHFNRVAAQDDLGIEALGAGLLRELVPGVVQTSISAGYYAYYPFLLDQFERNWPDELRRSEFQRFYRRQEAAFAVACSHHDHRGNLRGINGINAAWQAWENSAGGEIDISALAAPGRYMKTALGGYGLFYRPAIEDIGATRLGSGNRHIDRVTEIGRVAADGFRSRVADTEYWQRWAEAERVPRPVLDELGEAVCPCDVPGRPDHQPIIDTLFHGTAQSGRWKMLRAYRVQSFGLLLEFQSQRPEQVSGIGEWRRALISGRIAGAEWSTAFGRHRDAWRAYQYRETLVAALTTVFTNLLFTFDDLGPAGLRAAAERALAHIQWDDLPCTRNGSWQDLVDGMAAERSRPEALIGLAEAAMDYAAPVTIGESLTAAIRLLGALAVEPAGDADFQNLLDRGDQERLSVTHMGSWLLARSEATVSEVAGELIQYLFHRHLRVATSKLTATDHRDPFCVAEEADGRYRVVRSDSPFWTGARFATLNHLLWTAGVLDGPDGDGRPTDLGRSLLAEATQNG